MKRREFFGGLGRRSGDVAARGTYAAERERGGIGALMMYAETDRQGQAFVASFRQGLQTLGWFAVPHTSAQIVRLVDIGGQSSRVGALPLGNLIAIEREHERSNCRR